MIDAILMILALLAVLGFVGAIGCIASDYIERNVRGFSGLPDPDRRTQRRYYDKHPH